MSLFEKNSKFAPLIENQSGINIKDLKTLFESYGNDIATLIKEYRDYFEWEASSTIASEPAYVNNTNIAMKFFWDYIENRFKIHSSVIDSGFITYKDAINFVYQVQSELDAIRLHGDTIDVYQGIANEWENYDENFARIFFERIDLFDKKFSTFIIEADLVGELTDITKEKQEYCETLSDIKIRVKKETIKEKDYYNNLFRDEEYQLLSNMLKSAQNYMSSLVYQLYTDEKLQSLPKNSAFDSVYPDRLFYSTDLTKDELLQYLVKPSYGIEDAGAFLKKIYNYMWEYIPDEKKMMLLTYAILDVARYDYHKNIMQLESISATDNKKATKLLNCKRFLKTIIDVLDYAKFEFGHQYERDEKMYDYIDSIENEFRHNFDDAYDRRMLLIFPDLVEKYNQARDELFVAFRENEENGGEHHKNSNKLQEEIKEFIQKESQNEIEREIFR